MLLRYGFIVRVNAVLFFTALSFSSAQTALAEGNGSFRLETGIGTSFSLGEHHEIVYRSDSSSDVMSLLVWPLPPSIGVWLDAKAAWPGPLETALRLKADFPLDEGTQTDDDWDIGISPRIHSESRAFLVSDFEARSELLYKIVLGPFEMKPGAGFFYQYVNWQGWDGIQTVAGYDDSIEDYYYYNLIFTYEQKWFVPYARFTASVRTGRIDWLLGLNYSPYLFCEAIDHHVTNAMNLYSDRPKGGWMLEPSFSVEYRANDRLSLIASGEFRWIQGLRGDTVMAATQWSGDPIEIKNDLLRNQSGVSQFRMEMCLGAKYTP